MFRTFRLVKYVSYVIPFGRYILRMPELLLFILFEVFAVFAGFTGICLEVGSLQRPSEPIVTLRLFSSLLPNFCNVCRVFKDVNKGHSYKMQRNIAKNFISLYSSYYL